LTSSNQPNRIRSVLISGAGIGGPTLAYWLAQQGIAVTLVERAAALRSSGSPVDVRDGAVDVVRRMGLFERLRDAGTAVDSMAFIDGRGRLIRRLPMQDFAGYPGDSIELPRGDLARALFDAARPKIELRMHDSIASLRQDAAGVDVEFERGASARFDLVVGADGLHSNVRAKAFGSESEFVHHAGLYVATLPLEREVADRREVTMFNAPARSLTIHPSKRSPLAAFIFWGAQGLANSHDLVAARLRISELYRDDGWLVPEVLSCLDQNDFWFDAVSQVRIARWSNGRVVLLGDAASSISLFGGGSSLAIQGASALAEAIAAHPTDPALALESYERAHRPRVMAAGRGMHRMASLLVPRTRLGLGFRNVAVFVASYVARLKIPDRHSRVPEGRFPAR
jgi:2-polyprenyl-6-methoxyphenol hydroxylase-like FAD-dependent oxidoreductase